MTLILDELTESVSFDDDEGLTHFYCCDPDVALCGTDLDDVTDTDISAVDEKSCVVCVDLAWNTDGCALCHPGGVA